MRLTSGTEYADSVQGYLWEEEVGDLADAAFRCLAEGLFTNVF